LVQGLRQILPSENDALATAAFFFVTLSPVEAQINKNYSQYHTIAALPRYSSAQLVFPHAVSPFTGPSVGKARTSSNIAQFSFILNTE
jgi:hypothetical protein